MVRLLLKLKAKDNCRYDCEYHYNVQGLIYSLLRDSKYDNHDKPGTKFFSFSNIFPYSNLRKHDIRNLLISSPNEEFIDFLQQQLEYNKEIVIGSMRFHLLYTDKRELKLPSNNEAFNLITGTPIIIRIKKEKFVGRFELPNDSNHKYEYFYWRTDYPLDFFIEQLETNLIKKYKKYCFPDGYYDDHKIFNKFKFKNQILTKVNMNTKTVTTVGTKWEFIFDNVYDGHSKILQFGLDCGLGELNSVGFGFMNLVRGRSGAIIN